MTAANRRLARFRRQPKPRAGDPFTGRFFDRHALDRLIATDNAALELATRCACPGVNGVRCVEDAGAVGAYCPPCRELCR